MMPAHSKQGEILARRKIEDLGYVVLDANIALREHCPNIDLIVLGRSRAFYVQVKLSQKPAEKDCIVIDGAPWTDAQLYERAPIFNKRDGYHAQFIVIVDKSGPEPIFYVAPPKPLEMLVRKRSRIIARRPKRDGSVRSIGFRKELPRELLQKWREAWELLDGE